MLAVAPPGDAASSISPTASGGSRLKARAMRKHTTGRINIWQASPTITALGKTTTRLKSSIFKPRPRPSMITPSAIGRSTVVRKPVCMSRRRLLHVDLGELRTARVRIADERVEAVHEEPHGQIGLQMMHAVVLSP